MNKLGFIKASFFVAIFLFATSLFGCVKENKNNCGVNARVTVNVATVGDLDAIEKVTLFVYDQNSILLDSIITQIGEQIVLNYPSSNQITLFALCNALPGYVTVSPLIIGESSKSNGYVALISRSMTKATPMAIYTSPSDVFLGSKEITGTQTQASYTIPVSRQIASMNITTRGLNRNSGNYEYVVGTTKNKMAFTNELFGDDAGYLPVASFNVNNELIAPLFNTFPSMQDEVLHIRLLRDGVTIYELSEINGVPLHALADQTLNILIDFKSATDIGVGVVLSKWGEVYQWEKIFD